jgi:geranylgeranylglycerol-phosphate geranylgeranyltransferase
MAALAVLVAGFIALGSTLLSTIGLDIIVLAMLVAFLFTGAGNSLNDYFDAETDRKNHPERPLPSGLVERPAALRLAIELFVVANGVAAYISFARSDFLPFLIVLLATGLMVAYELELKARGLGGNVVVSVLVGFAFLFGGAVAGGFPTLVLVAVLAALANTGREIIKDVEDVAGDVDRVTLPKVVGARWAVGIGALFLLGAVSMSWLPWYARLFGLNYLLLVVAADAVFIYAAASAFSNPERSQNLVKLGMLVALASFVVGRL